jgi:hypothetical protein
MIISLLGRRSAIKQWSDRNIGLLLADFKAKAVRGPNPKPETRDPKEIRNPKSQTRRGARKRNAGPVFVLVSLLAEYRIIGKMHLERWLSDE